jgi:hypothetical protein
MNMLCLGFPCFVFHSEDEYDPIASLGDVSSSTDSASDGGGGSSRPHSVISILGRNNPHLIQEEADGECEGYYQFLPY